MSESTRERLARALLARRHGDYLAGRADDLTAALADVDALLDVLAEPSKAVSSAGCEAWSKAPLAVVTQWRSMIQAIREGK